jgi:hypothetical protein
MAGAPADATNHALCPCPETPPLLRSRCPPPCSPRLRFPLRSRAVASLRPRPPPHHSPLDLPSSQSTPTPALNHLPCYSSTRPLSFRPPHPAPPAREKAAPPVLLPSRNKATRPPPHSALVVVRRSDPAFPSAQSWKMTLRTAKPVIVSLAVAVTVTELKVSDESPLAVPDVPVKSALRPPKQAPSMWQVFFADWLAQHKNRSPHDKLNVAQAAKEAGVEYKNLSAQEKEVSPPSTSALLTSAADRATRRTSTVVFNPKRTSVNADYKLGRRRSHQTTSGAKTNSAPLSARPVSPDEQTSRTPMPLRSPSAPTLCSSLPSGATPTLSKRSLVTSRRPPGKVCLLLSDGGI